MDRPPRFIQGPEEAKWVFSKLKLMVCPYCGAVNRLIRNGKLRGCDPHGYGNASIIRGQRILCSSRGKNKGCGRSLTIYFKWIIPGFTVDAHILWMLLDFLRRHSEVHQAWLRVSRYFSLSSACRWWRRLVRNQTYVRAQLWRVCPPPDCASPEPKDQFLEHLHRAFGEDPLAGFQLHFQTSVFS